MSGIALFTQNPMKSFSYRRKSQKEITQGIKNGPFKGLKGWAYSNPKVNLQDFYVHDALMSLWLYGKADEKPWTRTWCNKD